MLKILKLEGNMGYSIPKLNISRVPIREIGNIIREKGVDIKVETPEGHDFTLETMFKSAFMNVMPPRFSEEKISYICEILDYDTLYKVIENGGIMNYVNRKARGFVNE